MRYAKYVLVQAELRLGSSKKTPLPNDWIALFDKFLRPQYLSFCH